MDTIRLLVLGKLYNKTIKTIHFYFLYISIIYIKPKINSKFHFSMHNSLGTNKITFSLKKNHFYSRDFLIELYYEFLVFLICDPNNYNLILTISLGTLNFKCAIHLSNWFGNNLRIKIMHKLYILFFVT